MSGFETITSMQNPRVKEAARLRDRRHRARQQRFLIDGLREVERAAHGQLEILEAFYCPELCEPGEATQPLAALLARRVAVIQVTPAVFARLAFGDRAEGLVAVAATPRLTLENLQLPAAPLVAVLEGIEKPGNLGAILRSADAAGVSAVIVADGVTDVYNPNAVRASLGTIFSMPLVAASSAETLAWLRGSGISIYAARLEKSQEYSQVALSARAAMVLGSEAHGLTSAWYADDVVGIRLPMLGIADSLNVSATAAVLFYEALRQRQG